MAICKVCGWWDRICHCKDLELFNLTKDKLFHFTDYNTFSKPVDIRGKDHFDKLCKQEGLTWRNIKQARRTEKDFRQEKYEPVPRKQIADMIHRELKDRGLHGKLLKRR